MSEENALVPMREYTPEILEILTRKNELGDYLSFSPMLEQQFQELWKRPDLKIGDFVAFCIREQSKINVLGENLKPSWNKRTVVCNRLGIDLIKCPEDARLEAVTQPIKQMAVADTSKIGMLGLPLPKKEVVPEVKNFEPLPEVPETSKEKELLELKSRLEALLSKE